MDSKKNNYINVSRSASLTPNKADSSSKQKKENTHQISVKKNSYNDNKAPETMNPTPNNKEIDEANNLNTSGGKDITIKTNKKTLLILAASLVVIALMIVIIPKLSNKNVSPNSNQSYHDNDPSQNNSNSQNQIPNNNQNQDPNNQTNNKYPYKVKTLVELNVRSGHSKNNSIVRVVKKVGTVLEVYDEYQDSEYLWRKIGSDEWIADNGKWVQVIQ